MGAREYVCQQVQSTCDETGRENQRTAVTRQSVAFDVFQAEPIKIALRINKGRKFFRRSEKSDYFKSIRAIKKCLGRTFSCSPLRVRIWASRMSHENTIFVAIRNNMAFMSNLSRTSCSS